MPDLIAKLVNPKRRRFLTVGGVRFDPVQQGAILTSEGRYTVEGASNLLKCIIRSISILPPGKPAVERKCHFCQQHTPETARVQYARADGGDEYLHPWCWDHINPRWRLCCHALKVWPLGRQFIEWNRGMLNEFRKLSPTSFMNGSLCDHADYDTWLKARVGL